jgi:DNA primase
MNVTACSVSQSTVPAKARATGRQFPAATLALIKYTCPIDEFLSEENILLRRSGRRLVGRCPFHESKSGRSLSIDPKNNLWWCFGCRRGGDVITLCQLLYRIDFRTAVELLAVRAGMSIDVPLSLVAHDRIRWQAELAEVESRIDAILDAEFMRSAGEYDQQRKHRRRVQNRLDAIHHGAPERFPGEEDLAWMALAESTNALRRIDTEYVLLAFGARADREKFCAADSQRREQIVDDLLEVGYVVDEHLRYREVPIW